MSTLRITGATFAEMLRGGAVNLRKNAEQVNDLNVFPIPDGDTGENMSRTIEGGAACLNRGDISAVSRGAADGMLLAARGNSGVILSQFFEGIAQGLSGCSDAGCAELTHAFECGVRQAYSAVVKPCEGTMLTVMREAVEYAQSELSGEEDTEVFLSRIIARMRESLSHTPELLPVLKEAGVIDSGGAGLIYIMVGMSAVLSGTAPENPDTFGYSNSADNTQNTAFASGFGPDSVMEYGYCTEFLLQLMRTKCDPENFDVKPLISWLEGVGDSIVAFKTGTIVKVHVHTMTPERVLEYCHRYGEFVTLKVENMSVQHSESVFAQESDDSAKQPEKEIAVVCAASGDGLCAMLREFGADAIVDGQQTMNPSARDFIDAFSGLKARHIIVLPNNSNIILTARQAAEMYADADVRVVETRTLAEGYVAMTMLDTSSGNADEVEAQLSEAVEGVRTGLVTYAVRDSVVNGIQVQKGDWLGFDGDEMLCRADGSGQCAAELMKKMNVSQSSAVIALYGKDAGAEDCELLRDSMRNVFPSVEFYEADGGQDVYSFIFAVE